MELTVAANYCFHSLIARRTEPPGNPRKLMSPWTRLPPVSMNNAAVEHSCVYVLFMAALAEQLQQRPSGQQSLRYLRTGPL